MEFKIFRVTLKQVMERLEEISDIEISELQDAVIEAFDGYNYEGEEDLVGFDDWSDISQDGVYELPIRIDHEHSYEMTLHTQVLDSKATIINVL